MIARAPPRQEGVLTILASTNQIAGTCVIAGEQWAEFAI